MFEHTMCSSALSRLPVKLTELGTKSHLCHDMFTNLHYTIPVSRSWLMLPKCYMSNSTVLRSVKDEPHQDHRLGTVITSNSIMQYKKSH